MSTVLNVILVILIIIVAALAVLAATLWMPVLRVYGSSMAPTLHNGEILVSVKTKDFSSGDIIAFYHGNKLLIKRYIAGPSDYVNVDEDGNVSVNGTLLGSFWTSPILPKRPARRGIWNSPLRCRKGTFL